MAIEFTGSEFVVNTTTAEFQDAPKVTALSDGRFMVTWASFNPLSTGWDIRGRVYDANGTPAPSDFVINTDTSSAQVAPSIAALDDGRFLVTWESFSGPASLSGLIQGRVYNADGTPAGNEFSLAGGSGDAFDGLGPNVTGLANGRFVLTNADPSETPPVINVSFWNNDGTSTGVGFILAASALETGLAALTDGRVVVTWRAFDGAQSNIFMQVVNPEETPPDPIEITTTPGDYFGPSAAPLPGGGFVVTWGTGFEIRGRVYDANGAGGDEFIIYSATSGFNPDPAPSVTTLSDGYFVVTWHAETGLAGNDIFGRVYATDGTNATPDGDAFTITTTTTASEFTPSVTSLPDGGFVVTWQSGDEIRGQILSLNEAPTAVADTGSAGENETKSFDVLANDTDPDGDTKTLVSLGTVTVTSANAAVNAVNAAGAFSIFEDQLRFAPGTLFDPLTATQTATLTVDYTMQDGQGAPSSSVLTLTVNGANDDPVLMADSGSASENETKLFAVLANDMDVDAGDSLRLVNNIDGSINSDNLKVDGIAIEELLSAFSVVDNQLQFAPGTLFDPLTATQTATVTINYNVLDDWNVSASEFLTLTINGVNDLPAAVADAGSAGENETKSFDVLANDADPDTGDTKTLMSLGTVTVTSANGAVNSIDAGGVFSIVGNQLQFAPGTLFDPLAATETATVTVAYTMQDGQGAESSSVLTLTINGADDAITNGNSGGTLNGTSGDDVIDAGGGNDTVNAGDGNDTITAGSGNDVVNGGAGNDTMVAAPGDGFDVYVGGAGIDTLDMSAITAPVTINLAPPPPRASSSQTGIDLASVENVIGGSGNDQITGDGVANVLDGRGGNDTINAGGGADTIIGGIGNDTMNGGLGNDVFVFRAGFGNDRILSFDANPAGGQDRLDLSALGITAGDFAARVVIADVGADTLVTVDGTDTIRLLGIGNATTVTIDDFLL
jgi:hypothetical protein